MTGGELRFAEIARLLDHWWTSAPPSDPADVWKTWKRDTLYLWGADSGNYKGLAMGALLNGDGMASVAKGPSRGRAITAPTIRSVAFEAAMVAYIACCIEKEGPPPPGPETRSSSSGNIQRIPPHF